MVNLMSKNMEIAIIKSGATQHIVKVGKIICVNKISANAGDKLTFTDLLGDKKVEAEVLKQGKTQKIRVFKFKNKTGYKKTQNHRQDYTQIKIIAVGQDKIKEHEAEKIENSKKTVKPEQSKAVKTAHSIKKPVKIVSKSDKK